MDASTLPEVQAPLEPRSPSSLRPNPFLRRATFPVCAKEGGSTEKVSEVEVHSPKESSTHRPHTFLLRTHEMSFEHDAPSLKNVLGTSSSNASTDFVSSGTISCQAFPSFLSGVCSVLGKDSGCSVASSVASDVASEMNKFEELRDVVYREVPDAEVVFMCKEKPKSAGDVLAIDLVDCLQVPKVIENAAVTVFIVEHSVQCVERACSLLRACARHQSARLAVLLAERQDHPHSRQSEVFGVHIDSFIGSGAHDAVAWPGDGKNLPSLIAASCRRALAHKERNKAFVQKIRQAHHQCDSLFWKNAHKFVEGFPKMKCGVREVQGEIVENLMLEQKLGQGTYGIVYSFQDLRVEERCGAAKVIAKAHVTELRQLSALSNEYHALAKVGGHPNVVQGFSFLHAKLNIYIFMEMAGTSSLNCLIRSNSDRGLTESRVQTLFQGVSSGLAHCHELQIAHCDLKPENIVLTEDGCAKIVDFGEAVHLDGDIAPLTFPIGTMPFQAPEVMTLADPWKPTMSDVWALGVVLLEMLCGFDALPRIMRWPRKGLKPVTERAQELASFFADFGTDKALESQALAAVISHSRVSTQGMNELLIGILQIKPEDRMPASDVAYATLRVLKDCVGSSK